MIKLINVFIQAAMALRGKQVQFGDGDSDLLTELPVFFRVK
jgi:hypothetical protein